MASKNLMYKVDSKPTKELIEKFDEDEHIFYRFQEPHQKLTSRSESWGMIYDTKAEAIRNCTDNNLTEEEAVLPGKSCMDTFKGIVNGRWFDQFDNDYVLLIFKGHDTRANGHDDEYVATYYKKVAVWSMADVTEYANINLWAEEIA